MDLEKSVKTIIKTAFGDCKQFINFKYDKGTKPGENYGSSLHFVSATIRKKNQEEEHLSLVAKRLPPTEYLREVFNVNVSFPKEAAFYQKVLPEYIKLQKESGYSDEECIKAFPKFIGALFGPKNEVTADTTLVMENLTARGYRLGCRLDGVDLEHTKLVMQELAIFHALGIALKKKKPQVFEYIIKKDAGRPFKEGIDLGIIKKETDLYRDQLLQYLATFNECVELVPRLSIRMKEHTLYDDFKEGYEAQEPFCTFVHNDMWVNNVMFSYDETGRPKSVKIIDFQTSKIGSPACDVLHFLYMGSCLEVMKTNFDELLKFYHNNFFASLERLGVATEELDWKNFCKEFNQQAPREMCTPLCFLRIAKAEKDVDISEVNLDSFASFNEGENTQSKKWHIEIVHDIARRGWI